MSNRTQRDDQNVFLGDEKAVTHPTRSRSEVIDQWSRNTSIATSDHPGALQWARLLGMPLDNDTNE